MIRARALFFSPMAVCLLLAVMPGLGTPVLAQSFTAMPLDSGFGPLDTSQPVGTTPQQIIDRFTAKESEFKQALDNYTYTRSVKVDTINDEGKVDGEYAEVTDITFTPDSHKVEHVVFAPGSTLTRVMMSPADFSDIEHRLPFVLTQEDAGQYNITYVGKQKIDELETYAFDVAPKVMEKHKRYFKGRIWVDQHDYQIVVTDGKNVPDDTRRGHQDLSAPFTTYRQQIDGKYWFPVYTRSEGVLHFDAGTGFIAQDVHIREIVKYTDYKRFGSSIRVIYHGQDISNSKQSSGASPASAPAGTTAPAGTANGGAQPNATKPKATQPGKTQPDTGPQPTSTRPETPEPGDPHP